MTTSANPRGDLYEKFKKALRAVGVPEDAIQEYLELWNPRTLGVLLMALGWTDEQIVEDFYNGNPPE